MDSAVLQLLIKSLGSIGFLLLIGLFLRAKIPFFRKLLIPASLIGGFIGLLLGPVVLGNYAVLPFPQDWVKTWSLLPSIFIVPIFASIPLGNFASKDKKKQSKHSSTHSAARIAMVTGVHCSQMGTQIFFGIATALVLGMICPAWDLYNNFGFEMSQGFNGGHGTAGAVANVLMEAGHGNWELVQGVATTFATVGLLGGIILGIVHINNAVKKGHTVYLKDAATLSDSVSSGINTDISKQESMGRETTASSNMSCLSVHVALIIMVSALAYIVRGFAKANNIPGFKDIPVWPYALIIMFIVNFVIQKLNLEWLIDRKIKSQISGFLSDFAITAAIASMPIKAVLNYIVPISIICLVGFICVYITTIKGYRFLMPDSFPFERAMYAWGTGTGVAITGMALLKVCDPNFDSPTLSDYSVCSIIMSITDLVAVPIMYYLLCNGTSVQLMMFGGIYALCFITMALIGKVVYNRTMGKNVQDDKQLA